MLPTPAKCLACDGTGTLLIRTYYDRTVRCGLCDGTGHSATKQGSRRKSTRKLQALPKIRWPTVWERLLKDDDES